MLIFCVGSIFCLFGIDSVDIKLLDFVKTGTAQMWGSKTQVPRFYDQKKKV